MKNNGAFGDPFCVFWSLSKAINIPSVHSQLLEKYLEFIDGALLKSPPGINDIDKALLQ